MKLWLGDTVGVLGLDSEGTPVMKAGNLDTAELGRGIQPGSWSFWEGASGAVARASCGAEAGRRGT